tara:strand:+ start:83 stop:1669 length:1587 start_codon:yes stop_codon:yes gene_type:complete
MSDDKPVSPLPKNWLGQTVTTTVIRYKIYDSNGDYHDVTETIDLDMSGNTAGLTKDIRVRLNDGTRVLDITQTYVSKDGEELDLLNLIQNSSIREQKYEEEMNKIRLKAQENGTLEEFDEALIRSGVYDAIVDDNVSINEIEVKSEDLRNNEENLKEDDAENSRLEEFKKSIEVSNKDHKYPIDMKSDEGQDYIFFEQLEYLPPQNTARPQTFEGTDEKPGLKLDIETTLEGGVARGRNVSDDKYRRHGSCKLPIPNKLGVSNGVNWGEARANAVELSAFNSADTAIQNTIKDGNLLQLLKDAKDQAGGALNVLKNDLSGRSERSGNNINAGDILSATLARSVLGTIGINVDIDQFITRQTGAAINPNLELLFGGPQLRTFSFNFTFAPNSSKEAKEVREIQRWFRQGMLPSRKRASQSSGSSLFLASPNVFRIAYKNKNRRIKGLNIIKICALTSCQIDFTPDGTYQSYDDVDGISMPVRSTMGVSFTELTPVFKDDYSDKLESPSMKDLGLNVKGTNAIDENDIGL